MRTSMTFLTAALFIATLGSTTADARSIRVDSGDWDLSGFQNANATVPIGFSLNALGVNSSTAQISTTGQINLPGATESLSLLPFQEANQGQNVQFQYGTTNAFFNAPGVDAGFRVTWQSFDAVGALLNEFQASIFSLAGGSQFAVEFNYNSVLSGGNASGVGYSASTGTNFDLLATLGLSFAQASGVGDDVGTNNCANTPSALACNNYFAGTYGPGAGVLPNIANGFFTQIDTNGGTPQGRALFLFGRNVTPVPEPGTFALLGLGALAAIAGWRRRSGIRRR